MPRERAVGMTPSTTVAGIATAALLVAAAMFAPTVPRANAGDVCTEQEEVDCSNICYWAAGSSEWSCNVDSSGNPVCTCVC